MIEKDITFFSSTADAISAPPPDAGAETATAAPPPPTKI